MVICGVDYLQKYEFEEFQVTLYSGLSGAGMIQVLICSFIIKVYNIEQSEGKKLMEISDSRKSEIQKKIT